MKHIFLVINNINKVISEEIVKSLSISPDDVIFLYRRPGIEQSAYQNYKYYSAGVMCGLNDKSLIHFFKSAFLFSVLRLRRFDSYIEALAEGKNFEAYVPHAYLDDMYLLITHRLCQKNHFVEEGDASYIKNIIRNEGDNRIKRSQFLRFNLMRVFGINDRVAGSKFFPNSPKLGNAFSISHDAFPSLTQKNFVLSLKSCLGSVKKERTDFASMIMIDPLVLLNRIDQGLYLKGFRRFVYSEARHLKSSRLFVSFHPTVRNDQIFKEAIVSILSDFQINYYEFDGNVERLIANHSNFRLYALISSSMRYAKHLGAEVCSWITQFDGIDFRGKSELLSRYKEIGVDLR